MANGIMRAALGGFIAGASFMGVFLIHPDGMQYPLLALKIIGMIVGAYLIADARSRFPDC